MTTLFAPPEGAGLNVQQREALDDVVSELESTGYDRSAILSDRERLVDILHAAFTDADDGLKLYDELYARVRWYRLQGYWLSYLLQGLTTRLSPTAVLGPVVLHADAQLRHAYEDYGVQSLEAAYAILHQGKDNYDNFAGLERGTRLQLSSLHDHFAGLLRDFSFEHVNPLASHPYTILTWSDLHEAFPSTMAGARLPGTRELLMEVIDRCAGADVYCRAVAHRFLGHVYAGLGKPDDAVDAFRRGAEEAQSAGLDAETGHAYRCLGHAFELSGDLYKAMEALAVAYRKEEHPLFSYWRALTAREAGDVAFRLAVENLVEGRPNPEFLGTAGEFYRDGRSSLQVHLMNNSVLPAARSAKLQMMRAYSANSFQVAGLLRNSLDMLAEVAANSPNESLEAMIELDPAWHTSPAEGKQRRGDRAVFYRHLTTTPEPVEAYIDAIPAEQDARSRYFWARRRMSEEIALVELSDDAVVRFASEQLNLPDCCYLFFHLGVKIGVLCVAGDRTSLRPAMGPTSEGDLRALHDAYARELPPLEVLAEDLGAKEAEAALDRLLEGYEEHLGRYFEQFLDMFEGKQLKIFPRMLMNAAPLHAMKVRGKRLLEYCDVSYGQSLPLFTQLHREERGGTENLTFVHGEGVPLYEGMLRELWDDYGDRLTLLRQPGYDALAGAMTTEASGDLFFACHGQYFPENPMASVLRCGQPGGVSFLDLLTDLQVPRFRTVIMGACESSLGRSEIASEFIGLPNIFLAAGVRYVVGSLWKVNQLATAVLLGRCCGLLSDGASPPAALNRAQRDLMQMTNDEVIAWVEAGLPALAASLKPLIERRGAKPFAHPRHWAGFYVQGDV